VAREDEIRKQRYDCAAVPWDSYADDPSVLLGTIRALVEQRGQVGDVVFFMVPQGKASETMHYLIRHLEARTGSE
jgi:hypothetical protein